MSHKLSVGKKVASIVGIAVASTLIVLAFCGRFCNTEGSQGFMHFANFFVGSFGMAFYGMMAAVIISCACILAGKSINIPAKYIVNFALMFVAVVLLVHTLTTTYLPMSFKSHMSLLYHYYDDHMGVPSFGGVVFGLLAWCLKRVLTVYGFWIPIVALLAWTVYVAGDFFYKFATGKLILTSKSSKDDIEPSKATIDVVQQNNVEKDADDPHQRALDILFRQQETSVSPEVVSTDDNSTKFDVADQSQIDKAQRKPVSKSDAESLLFGGDDPHRRGGNSFFEGGSSQKKEEDEYLVKGYYQQTSQQVTEKPVETPADWKISYVPEEEAVKSGQDNQIVREQPFSEDKSSSAQEERTNLSFVPVSDDTFGDNGDEIDITDVTVDAFEDDAEESTEFKAPESQAAQSTLYEQPKREEFIAPEPVAVNVAEKENPEEIVALTRYDEVDGGIQEGIDFVTKGDLEKAKEKVHQYLEYNVPPLELLNDITIVEDHDDGERQRLAQAIINKLAVFNIKIELADIIVGPTVTRYMFTVLSQKTRMSDFKQYSDDIKACVEAQEDILIDAPVKGTNMVGIEVANKVKRPVVLRALLDTPEFKNAEGRLVFAIGQEITGKVVLADLAEMPHLLVAGTTGSGKSVCLNCLIVSLLYKYGPEYVRFVMVDPKFVELSRYNGIPQMLTTETITTMQDALASMDYLIAEMEARYQLFRQSGVDKIVDYNKRINPKLAQKMPYLVFVVDELADLMATNKSAFEAKLIRLAQKGRACGIHIVLATQRPDVKVITGTIKGNLPCRMALKVSSVYDSQTIIGCGGAEKLLGRGDMLFMNSTGSSELTRVQGAYVSNDEIRALVKYSIESNEVFYDTSISKEIFVSRAIEEEKRRDEEAEKNGDGGGKDELYPFYKKALRYWLERNGGKASISSIQRGINVGFNRAGRIMENLQKMGYVEELSSSETSNRAVRVLVTLEELDDLFPDVDDE